MEKLLTKYFWIFNVVALTLVAFFLAQGTGEMAASTIENLLPQAKETPKKKATPKRRARQLSTTRPPRGDAILSRNLFDSEMGPISRYPDSDLDDDGEESPEVLSPDGLPIVPCDDTRNKLVSTVASREAVEWSFATVLAEGKTRMYRVGDDLSGRTVSGITWRYMFLRGSSDECYMDMFADPNQKPPTPKAAAANKGPSPEGDDDRIRKVSDTEAVVERSLVNELLSDPTKFVRSVRVRPHREGGKVVGYKLRRFRADSPLAKLGAQKGDVIRSVNGVDLTSVDKALGAYQSMRSANDLTFSILRQGKPMDLKVSIR